MSAWRRKAIECLPEQRQEFEGPNCTIYSVFMEMGAAVAAAHLSKDEDSLTKIYAFAEWCFHQKAKDLWNAAGVVFYEHLGDEKNTFEEFPKWVNPAIYKDIRGLLECRLEDEKMRQLDTVYAFKVEKETPQRRRKRREE